MAQHDMSIANQGMAAARSDINNALQALASTSIGSSEPTTKYTGQLWIDNGATPWVWKVYDGSDWISVKKINASTDKAWPVLSSVGESILFDTDNTYDIGDATNGIGNLYMSGTGDANSFYQTGTWTPSLTGLADTPGTQFGHYRRIGDLVFFSGRLILAGKTGVSGNVSISGLPFTSHATGHSPITFGQVEDITYGAPDIEFTGTIGASQTTVTLNFTQSGAGTDSRAVTDADIGTNFGFIFSGGYLKA